jgi:hypothetical protein
MKQGTQTQILVFASVALMTFGILHMATMDSEPLSNYQQPPPQYNPQPEPPGPSYLGRDQAIETIQAAELKTWLYYLASPELDGRRPNTEGYAKAADYVEKHCKEWGLKTERQAVPRRDENVFAYIEGSDPQLRSEVIVVGAHLDHLGNGRLGADDNGSGSVSVMAIAKAFSTIKPPKRTVVFQWYTAEESGLIGSRYYVENPTFPKSGPSMSKHMAMINLDMVGRLNRDFSVCQLPQLTASRIDLYSYVDQLDGKYGFPRRITQKGAGGSDHTPFLRKNVPAVFIHTGTHRDYHRTTDTVEKINYEGMEQIARYAFELAHMCTESPQLNKVFMSEQSFRVPIYHDHMDGVPFPNPY